MMAGQRQSIAHRLHTFVTSALTDANFERELRFHPRLALGRHGLGWEPVPAELPLPSFATSVRFDDAALFGTTPALNGCRPAEAERIETKLCLARARPLLLDHAPEGHAAELALWYSSLRMTALLSPFEFVPVADSLKAGYSNTMSHVRPARPGSGAWRSVLAGWEPERVMLAWLSLLFQWDELLGETLGYPACCTAAFPGRWKQAVQNDSGDVAAVILERTCPVRFAGVFGWETNVFARYFGWEIIQHFPCRLDCPSSVALARRNLATLGAFQPRDAAQLRGQLSSPVLFTRNRGVAIFPQGCVKASTGSAELDFDVDRVLIANAGSDLNDALHRTGGRLTVSAEGLNAGGETLDGWLIDFR